MIRKLRIRWFLQKPHMEQAMKRLGWEQAYEREHSDFYWHDLRPRLPEYKHETQPYAINKISGILERCRKITLSNLLKRKQKSHPGEYDFHPKSWSLPAEYNLFVEECRTRNEDGLDIRKKTYIFKPDAGSRGNGIFLSNKPPEAIFANGKKYCVQEYIDHPLLLNGYKFDLRLFVVIARVDPPEIYLCKDGLIRLCTKKYEPPCEENFKDRFMHISNYGVNVRSQWFVKTNSLDNGWCELKKTLSSYGHDVELATRLMKDLAAKTVLVMLEDLKNSNIEDKLKPARCFHVIGVDVILSSTMKPYLLEINSAPSFRINQRLDPSVEESETYIEPVDSQVKVPLITDVLELIAMGEENIDMKLSCLERIYPVDDITNGRNVTNLLGKGFFMRE